MSANSAISWTTHTFNPWRGCTKVSPGCKNCYAEILADRFAPGSWGPEGVRKMQSEAYWKQPLLWNRRAGADGRRDRVFCASMSDVFEDRSELVAPRVRLFHLIFQTPHLDWQLLTKRPENIERFYGGDGLPRSWTESPPPNIWLGVSAEDQEHFNRRWAVMRNLPAAVRFVSYEPALGPLTVANIMGPKPDWIIAGGESGTGRRNCEVKWFENLATECQAAGIAFFMKQDVAAHPGMRGRLPLPLWETKEFPPSALASA